MDRRHSDWREMVPLCGFDLHFSDNEWCWACFHVFVCISSLEKCLFSSLAHFLIGSFIYTENMLLWVMSSNVYDRALWHSKTILFLPSWHSSELFFYYTSESIYCFQSHVKSFPGHASGLKKKKKPAKMQEASETLVLSLGQEDPLEEGMAIHSNILAWRIQWTEEPGGP